MITNAQRQNTTAFAGIGTRSRAAQRGFSLIIVLIFLVTLSVIAAAGIREILSGERINANARDRSLAFQAAESTGREALRHINSTGVTGVTTGYYTAPFAGGGDVSFWRTTSSLTQAANCTYSSTTRFNWTSCAATATSNYGNTNAPQYVIEQMPVISAGSGSGEQWYRITTRASGGSGEADVILQLMFTP